MDNNKDLPSRWFRTLSINILSFYHLAIFYPVDVYYKVGFICITFILHESLYRPCDTGTTVKDENNKREGGKKREAMFRVHSTC